MSAHRKRGDPRQLSSQSNKSLAVCCVPAGVRDDSSGEAHEAAGDQVRKHS